MRQVESIKALLKADGINQQDKDASLKSISETCMPKKLSSIYLKYIYEEINDPIKTSKTSRA